MQLAKIELVMGDDRFPCMYIPTDRIMDNVETHKVTFGIDTNRILQHHQFEDNRIFWSGLLYVMAGGKDWWSGEFETILKEVIRDKQHGKISG
jgi:hypothetical protein